MEDSVNKHRIDKHIEESKEFYNRKNIASLKVFACKNFIAFSKGPIRIFQMRGGPPK